MQFSKPLPSLFGLKRIGPFAVRIDIHITGIRHHDMFTEDLLFILASYDRASMASLAWTTQSTAHHGRELPYIANCGLSRPTRHREQSPELHAQRPTMQPRAHKFSLHGKFHLYRSAE